MIVILKQDAPEAQVHEFCRELEGMGLQINDSKGSDTYTSKAEHVENSSTDLNKKVDFSIPVGVSFEYANVVVDFRYNIGLTKIYKSVLNDINSRNKVFALTVGYKLDL